MPPDDEPTREMCVGNCHTMIEVDADDPEFVPFCGSPTCRAYAEAEARADSHGLI